MCELLAFVKTDLKPEDQPIHLTSAKQKYDLMKISHHGNLTSKIFTYIIAVVGLIIAVIVILAIGMAWKRHDHNKRREEYPQVRINFQSLLASQGKDLVEQATSKNDEMNEKDRRLTVGEEPTTEGFVQLKV